MSRTRIHYRRNGVQWTANPDVNMPDVGGVQCWFIDCPDDHGVEACFIDRAPDGFVHYYLACASCTGMRVSYLPVMEVRAALDEILLHQVHEA